MGWVAPQYGYWGDGANWDTGMLPSLGDDVLLGHSGFYSVYVAGQQVGGSLSITNPDASLEILSGSSLDLYGDLVAEGSVVVNPKGLDGASTLRFMADATLGGGGGMRLVPGGDGSSMIEVAGGATLTLGESQRITGGGRFVGDVDVRGVVIADDRSGGISFADGRVDLHGALIAGFDSGFSLDQVEFTMHDGAEIVLGGTGSELILSTSELHNVHLELAEGSLLHLPATGRPSYSDDVELIGSVIEGRIEILNYEDLHVHSSRIVDGEILMRVPEASRGRLIFGSDVEFEGQGTIRVESDDLGSTTLNTLGAVSVNEYVIEGFGKVAVSLNESEIRGDTSGMTLLLSFNAFRTNSGVIRAVNGGVVRLEHGASNLLQVNGGEIVADGEGSIVEINRTIENGFIRSLGGGKVMALEMAWFLDVINEGDLFSSDEDVRIVGAMTNNGRIYGNLTSPLELALGGDGEVELLGGVSHIGTQGDDPGLFTHLAGHTISGSGVIRSRLVNHGVIRASVYQGALDLEYQGLSGDLVENHGSLMAVGGATLGISQNVMQGAGGVLRAAGPGSEIVLGSKSPAISREINGGRIVTSTGGKVRVIHDVSLTEIEADAHMIVEGGLTLDMSAITRFDGRADLIGNSGDGGTSLIMDGGKADTWEGTILLYGPWNNKYLRGTDGEFTVGAGMRLEGAGHDGDALRVHGVLAPGVGVGNFETRMPLILEGVNAVLEIKIYPVTNNMLILSHSPGMYLGGTLRILFESDFKPTGYWARVVVSEAASADMIQFREVEIEPAPAGLVTKTYFSDGSLLVGQTCLADINLDGEVNFFDVSEFVRLYQEGWLGVDLNGDGGLDFFDVTAFIVGYQQGCP